jgi:5'-3' exonuclease
MGIPYYVASLIRNHKHIQKNLGGGKVKTDILAIDFNCFIHHYLKDDNPIGSVVVALHELVTEIVDAKQVYVAFDGMVPYAKMVQQRYRRMRRQECHGFDRHQISPGTPYMKELSKTLKLMFRDMVVSDTLEPGEGEHKIFTWLRTLPADQRKTVTLYGLDADLVVIALAQNHLADIQLLRETEERGFSTISITELEKVLPIEKDTFIEMSILCFGNDFLPNLGLFSLRENGYTRAIYYSNRNDANKDEIAILKKMAKPENRHILAPDAHALETRMAAHLMDGVLDWEPVCYAFWKTYAWVLHYFTTSEVLDWEWVYPYPEAPLLTTIEDFERPKDFTWGAPCPTMTVDEQLQFILPERSLPGPPKYPDELYDEETESRHPWLRRFAWECDPYVSLPRGDLTSVTEVRVM